MQKVVYVLSLFACLLGLWLQGWVGGLFASVHYRQHSPKIVLLGVLCFCFTCFLFPSYLVLNFAKCKCVCSLVSSLFFFYNVHHPCSTGLCSNLIMCIILFSSSFSIFSALPAIEFMATLLIWCTVCPKIVYARKTHFQ